ncbi:restriction endonuclease subunit S [Micrococcus luteus]
MTFERVRLGSLAEVTVSNVDKHSVDGQPIVRLCNYTDVYYQHALDQSREYMVATASPDQIQKFRLQVDDVVITKDSETADDIGIPALITETADDFVCGYHLAILRPDPQKTDGRYLNWVLQSDDLKAQLENIAFGVTRVGLKTGRIKTLEVPVPGGQSAQARVADYLDRETATIDALIEKQRRLVDGLQRRRRGLLDEVWLRAQDVGARQRLKWHLRPSSETAPPGEEVLSVYRDHGVVPKSSRTDNFNRTPENVERYLWVRAGDVVVNKMKAWQGSIAVSHHQGLVSPDYEVLRPTSQAFDLRFLHYLLRCPRMIAEYRTQSVGIRPAQWRLYWDRLGLIEVPVPALGDQREIADHLDRETAKIDALIAKAERFIELAQERRAALITAAVTGQIEIPTED